MVELEMGAHSAGVRLLAAALVAAIWAAPSDSVAQVLCDKQIVQTLNHDVRGEVSVWTSGAGAVGFVSGMQVDADGAPDAYTPDNTGLSYTCDGMLAYEGGRCIGTDDVEWQKKCLAAFASAKASEFRGPANLCFHGVLVDGGERKGRRIIGGRPVTQKPGDLIPGNFISTTSLPVGDAPEGTQRSFVNSSEIAFLAVPEAVLSKNGLRLGDVAAVHRPATGKTSFAAIVDYGYSRKLGEGSIALHRALGNEPLQNRGGTKRAKRNIDDDVVYVLFPGTKVRPTVDGATFKRRIDEAGAAALGKWGGLDKLKACTPRR